MTQNYRAITDKRELWANELIEWSRHYKKAIARGDTVMEKIALSKIKDIAEGE